MILDWRACSIVFEDEFKLKWQLWNECNASSPHLVRSTRIVSSRSDVTRRPDCASPCWRARNVEVIACVVTDSSAAVRRNSVRQSVWRREHDAECRGPLQRRRRMMRRRISSRVRSDNDVCSECADRTFEARHVDFTPTVDTVNTVSLENVNGSHPLMVRVVLTTTSVLLLIAVQKESVRSYFPVKNAIRARNSAETPCCVSRIDVRSWIRPRVHPVLKPQIAVLVRVARTVDVQLCSREPDAIRTRNVDFLSDVMTVDCVITWNVTMSVPLMRIAATECDVNPRVALVRNSRDRSVNKLQSVVFSNHVLTEIASRWV